LKRCVLIVDDDPPVRKSVVRLVVSVGHEAVVAETVKAAIKALESGPSHVILDLNLPDGHGTAVLRHVRTNGLPIKVAVLTGSADPALLAEADQLRPDAKFKKPPDVKALLAWLAAA
jgi:CheY-like chemotaxis protein